MARLREMYKSEVAPALMKKFNYKSVMQIPKIDKIVITTQESGHRIINKIGELANPADRDHCIQYMVAIPLIYGELKAEHYEDSIASNPQIDKLREKMIVEQIIFTFISFAIFVLMFFRMIKNNDTTYVVILVLEAMGISLNFLEVLFDIKLNMIFIIIKYILAILLPILIIILEKKGISLLEMVNLQKAKIAMNLGDNKKAKQALLKAFQMQSSPDINVRINEATPVIFIERTSCNGATKGYLKFHGYGVVESVELITQYDVNTSDGYFSNYVFNMCVFSLVKDNEDFSWDWINARRDANLTNEETLKYAPMAWQEWVRNGVLTKVRRHVYSSQIVKAKEQKLRDGSKDEKILNEIYNYFEGKNIYLSCLQ